MGKMTFTERAQLCEAVEEDAENLVFLHRSPFCHHERQACQSEKSCGFLKGIKPRIKLNFLWEEFCLQNSSGAGNSTFP
jgi:hypothetical protein